MGKKVLLIPNAGIGDALIGLALLRKLKQKIPEMIPAMVVFGEAQHTLARQSGWVHDFIKMDAIQHQGKLNNRRNHSISRHFSQLTPHFDAIINLYDAELFSEPLKSYKGFLLQWKLEWLPPGGQTIYEAMVRWVYHHFGIVSKKIRPETYPLKNRHKKFARDFLKTRQVKSKRACVILKSGDPAQENTKDPSTRSIHKIIEVLQKYQYAPLLLPPSADAAACRNDWGGRQCHPIHVIQSNSIMNILGILEMMDLVIGPDTGFIHYAAHNGINTIGLSGHSHPMFYPYGSNTAIIDKGLGCPNKGNQEHNHTCAQNPRNMPGCLDNLSREDIMEALKELGLHWDGHGRAGH